MLQMNFILTPYFDWLLGPLKGQTFENKSLKIFSSDTVNYMRLILCINVPGISLYKDFLFQSDKNSGCYDNFQFAETYNGKSNGKLAISAVSGYLFIFFA